MSVPGILYVVATPIGNLKDITLRALEVLGRADVIACEDTRHTRRLLDRHGVRARTCSYHKFNERRRTREILALLSQGRSVALVTDAGTPGISDPGAHLVAAASDAGITVVPIPGPSAPATLLSVTGLPGTCHLFLGFLPHRRGERRRLLEAVATRSETLVFLEAPGRVAAALADAAAVLGGQRRVVVGRELTKLHEEVLRDNLAAMAARFAAEPRVRGELTVAVEGAAVGEADALPPGTVKEQMRHAREVLGLDRKEAMQRVARSRKIPRREVYAALLEEE